MARHILWDADEKVEQFTSEFHAALADLDRVEQATRTALDDLERISAP